MSFDRAKRIWKSAVRWPSRGVRRLVRHGGDGGAGRRHERGQDVKTLSFLVSEGAVFACAAGDTTIDNPKFKACSTPRRR